MSITADNYAQAELELFEKYKIPDEFRAALSHQAYEQGHWAGYGEVYSHLEDYVYNIESCINAYTIRILAEKK